MKINFYIIFLIIVLSGCCGSTIVPAGEYITHNKCAVAVSLISRDPSHRLGLLNFTSYNSGDSVGLYFGTINGKSAGKWVISGDTLVLYPRFRLYMNQDSLVYSKFNSSALSIESQIYRYVFRGDSIYDITDYTELYETIVAQDSTYTLIYKNVDEFTRWQQFSLYRLLKWKN